MQSPADSPFAAVIGLGPLKSEHVQSKRGRWINLGCGAVSLAAAPALALLALYLAYDGYSRRGLNHMLDNAILPLLGAGVAFVIGALVLFNFWRSRGVAAALYENGFAFSDRHGLKQVRWDQIEAVWQSVTKHYTNGVYTGTTHLYTVQPQGGQKIKLDDKLANVEALGTEIQRRAANTLFPRYVQALQSGQRLSFGPLAIDRDGLYSGTKTVRWDEIKAVKIERGMISVKKDKGWFNWATATVPQIPNFYVFYELLSRFTKVE